MRNMLMLGSQQEEYYKMCQYVPISIPFVLKKSFASAISCNTQLKQVSKKDLILTTYERKKEGRDSTWFKRTAS